MSTKKIKYASYGKTTDGTNYCSGVETLADNLMEDNEDDATIVFPSNDGLEKLVSSSLIRTTENVAAFLPYPLYKIKKMQIDPGDILIAYNQGRHLYNYKNNNGETLGLIDVSKYIVRKEQWDTLNISRGSWKDGEYLKGVYKDNTFFFSEGDNNIPFLTTIYKIGTSFWADDTPTYSRLIASALYDIGDEYNYYDESGQIQETLKQAIVYARGYISATDNIFNCGFRIEYVPMTSKTKIRARKNTPTAVDYIQPYNQRAEINAVSALGKNMYLTAQKTGVREIAIVKNYTKLADIPPLGALVRHNGKRYRLVANTYKQTNTIFAQVTHTLSENWTSRSKHIAVDQKYRNWKIPQDTLWRNLYWEDYVLISPEINADLMDQKEESKASVKLKHIMKMFNVSYEQDITISYMGWYSPRFGKTIETKGRINLVKEGVVVPCMEFGCGNSIIICSHFLDNISCGIRCEVLNESDLCSEVLYCDDDGSLSTTTIYLMESIGNYKNNYDGKGLVETEEYKNYSRRGYPAILLLQDEKNVSDEFGDYEIEDITLLNYPKNILFEKDFYVDKDPGEALKFTYQIHFVSDGGIIVGSKLAEHNPLIKRWERNRKFRLWLCTKFIRDFADLYVPNAQDRFYDTSPPDPDYPEYENEPPFVCEQYVDKADKKHENVYEIGFFSDYGYALRDNDKFVAWCITDENNNIYLACNDKKITTVYFQMTHKPVQK